MTYMLALYTLWLSIISFIKIIRYNTLDSVKSEFKCIALQMDCCNKLTKFKLTEDQPKAINWTIVAANVKEVLFPFYLFLHLSI